jgi:acyl-coenzyme A synthetase/AMP-(fatty) acid ligase
LDYVAAIRDIYIPLFTGAQTVMIPKRLFSTPRLLFDFVNHHNVTTLCWVAPALSLCSELNVFEETTLVYVNKVFFTGSVMPCKHLIVWQKSLPDSLFVNHYGPTEITASCSYYIVDHNVNEDEVLPIGVPFSNKNMFLLSETNESVPTEDIGEICVRGPGLALGYFNDLDRTKVSFTNNPLNTVFPETIYRTGDLGSIDENGIMYFHGRSDNQIKHMGHRIELIEIEAMTLSLDGISNVCCIYDQDKSTIWLFYSGLADIRTISKHLRERLPAYMVPRKYEKITEMPKLTTGKIDISILKSMISER